MKMNSLNKFLFLFKKSGNNSTQKCRKQKNKTERRNKNIQKRILNIEFFFYVLLFCLGLFG